MEKFNKKSLSFLFYRIDTCILSQCVYLALILHIYFISYIFFSVQAYFPFSQTPTAPLLRFKFFSLFSFDLLLVAFCHVAPRNLSLARIHTHMMYDVRTISFPHESVFNFIRLTSQWMSLSLPLSVIWYSTCAACSSTLRIYFLSLPRRSYMSRLNSIKRVYRLEN